MSGIAFLGWGSLIWDTQEKFKDWEGQLDGSGWSEDGPEIPLEFSRVSESRDRALTLVIDSENGQFCQVQWRLSKRKLLEDAIADLRCREGTNNAGVTHSKINPNDESNGDEGFLGIIKAWARDRDVEAVVWTALKSNFKERVGKDFSVEEAVKYLQVLPVEGKVKAAEYIWRAPSFVQTPLRKKMQTLPWFAEK